jgi:hypothetical protein
MWDGEYTVRIDHLKPLNYLPAECDQMQLISDACGGLRLRINRVYSSSLEETGQKSVAVVGEAESTLSYCCGREIVDASGVGIWEKTLSNFGNLASNVFDLQFQWS